MEINLDLKTALPQIREAFDSRNMQLFHDATRLGSACIYAAPCAIGVCLTEEERIFCDEQDMPGIGSLIDDDLVQAPANQLQDMSDLQFAHDNAVSNNIIGKEEFYQECVRDFATKLAELEVKYGTTQ